MFSVLAIVAPIFALILAGWLARRSGALGSHATTELNRFVVYLALPAMLFDVVANAHWHQLWQPGFVATFGIGTGVIFVATVVLRLRQRLHLADASVDGLNAAYANTGFIGFPLTVAVLGRDALGPTLIATIITVCLLFGFALILIEVGLQTESRPHHLLARVGGRVVRNPLLVSPALGALLLATGLTLPAPIESFLKLLGAAASPCALVALGLFLGERREGSTAVAGPAALLVGLKLLAQPLLTWILATQVFRLPALLTHSAVLLAALPTGTGPFMVAEFYRREAGVTSRVVLSSTLLSLITVTIYLSLSAH